MAKTSGLEVISEAVFEAVKRNKIEGGAKDWTGGKFLAERRPDLIKHPED
jgi:hypothetical protein